MDSGSIAKTLYTIGKTLLRRVCEMLLHRNRVSGCGAMRGWSCCWFSEITIFLFYFLLSAIHLELKMKLCMAVTLEMGQLLCPYCIQIGSVLQPLQPLQTEGTWGPFALASQVSLFFSDLVRSLPGRFSSNKKKWLRIYLLKSHWRSFSAIGVDLRSLDE